MNLSEEEIKRWNESIGWITGICNRHCTEENQCKGCPFDALRFGEYGEPEFCGIRAGVLYRGEWMVTPDDYLRNLKEKRLRAYEKEVIIKNCVTCHWRDKKTNFCPELGLHVMSPDIRMCDNWIPRHDLFDKAPITADASTDTQQEIPPQVENCNQEELPQ